MSEVQDLRVAPHCSVGPVALAAALHFGLSTPNFMIQESFADFDVPWRSQLVHGWDTMRDGKFNLSEEPGLGLDLDLAAIASHPYVPNVFPSLWDKQWIAGFTKADGPADGSQPTKKGRRDPAM